jgi:outer membrane receptor protein involved in Fe transport
LIPYAAKHQLQASLEFHGEVSRVGEWVLRPSANYRSEFSTTLYNHVLPAAQQALFGSFDNIALGGATVPGVTLVDFRAELNKIGDSNLGFAVGATNLFDKYYYIGNGGTLSFGVQGNAVGAPRMIYGEVSYRF